MKRVQGSGYRVQGYLVVIAFFLITYHLSLITVYAADSSPSATATQSSSLVQKINDIKQQIASKAAEIKKDVGKKLNNKFLWGEVLSKDLNTLSIKTLTGNKNIAVDDFTSYELGRSKATLKDLKVADQIAALGEIDDKGGLNAKRIVKITALKTDKKIIWGHIKKVSGNQLTLKTRAKDIVVNLGSNTSYFYGNQESAASEIGLNSAVIVTGLLKGEAIDASFIYIIPQSVSAAKTATSASSSATPNNP